ncbi:MAG TPA: outer membrane protein assembly factor BamD [Burkholderiaceae bacterium]|nr:outer membrane protein assembly factor BamD [Burkholderiaceae bacterium]
MILISSLGSKLVARLSRYTALLMMAFVVAACGTVAPTNQKTAEQLYAEAREELSGGAWDAAIKLYEQIQARYPFGRIAQQALIEQAYAHYKAGDNAQALSALDRFSKQYPNHPSSDYVQYLRGLVHFNDNLGVFAYYSGQDPTERDPKALRESFDAFKELIARYPESKYADDARARLSWLHNAMAKHEVHVARYYYRRGAYLAAANRAQDAVRDFQGAAVLEDALFIMVSAYDKLGYKDLSEDARRVLIANYPNSAYINGKKRLDNERPWWKLF